MTVCYAVLSPGQIKNGVFIPPICAITTFVGQKNWNET